MPLSSSDDLNASIREQRRTLWFIGLAVLVLIIILTILQLSGIKIDTDWLPSGLRAFGG